MNLQLTLERLAEQEKKELLIILKKELGETPQLDKVRSKINENQKTLCPHCHTDDIYGHGIYIRAVKE